jgi:D-glycero-D-manno-heptose 1,7-bisphosphate phosphatase
MYSQSAREWDVDLSQSYVVGDAMADVAAARAIGAYAILVLTGRGRENQALLTENDLHGLTVVEDLQGAVQWISQKEMLPS